jgi:hypothetical protein
VGLNREVMQNVSVSASFLYRKNSDLPWTINTQISPSDYTAITGQDPGPDGRLGTSDDGGPLTFYELSAAKKTLSPNYITTRPGFTTDYRNWLPGLSY